MIKTGPNNTSDYLKNIKNMQKLINDLLNKSQKTLPARFDTHKNIF